MPFKPPPGTLLPDPFEEKARDRTCLLGRGDTPPSSIVFGADVARGKPSLRLRKAAHLPQPEEGSDDLVTMAGSDRRESGGREEASSKPRGDW